MLSFIVRSDAGRARPRRFAGRQRPQPLVVDESTYFFQNPEGHPITTNYWPKKSWYPVLRRLEIRPRKFYATRHTFITR